MGTREVADSEIEAWLPLVESHARQLRKYAEYDDLRQEGMISVWEQLRDNGYVVADRVRDRMRNWIRQEKKLVQR
jgi:DNA-directed RNA polymerase specialized sigma subunit